MLEDVHGKGFSTTFNCVSVKEPSNILRSFSDVHLGHKIHLKLTTYYSKQTFPVSNVEHASVKEDTRFSKGL